MILTVSNYARCEVPGLIIKESKREKSLLRKGKGDHCCARSEHRHCFGSDRRGGFVGKLGRCRVALTKLRNRPRWHELLCRLCGRLESGRAQKMLKETGS